AGVQVAQDDILGGVRALRPVPGSRRGHAVREVREQGRLARAGRRRDDGQTPVPEAPGEHVLEPPPGEAPFPGRTDLGRDDGRRRTRLRAHSAIPRSCLAFPALTPPGTSLGPPKSSLALPKGV